MDTHSDSEADLEPSYLWKYEAAAFFALLVNASLVNLPCSSTLCNYILEIANDYCPIKKYYFGMIDLGQSERDAALLNVSVNLGFVICAVCLVTKMIVEIRFGATRYSKRNLATKCLAGAILCFVALATMNVEDSYSVVSLSIHKPMTLNVALVTYIALGMLICVERGVAQMLAFRR